MLVRIDRPGLLIEECLLSSDRSGANRVHHNVHEARSVSAIKKG